MDRYLDGLDQEFARMRSRECVQKSGDKSVVDVGIVHEDGGLPNGHRTSIQPIASAQDLDVLLDRDLNFRSPLIFYSLTSTRSLKPLNITEDLLRDIFLTHEIMSEFLRIVSCFYTKEDTSENGGEESFCPPFLQRMTGNKIEYAFAFKYAEHHGRELEPWSIRQSACYVQQNPVGNASVVILISPVLGSKAHKKISRFISTSAPAPSPLRTPHEIINLLISSHLSDWRDYLVHYEKQIQQIEHHLLTPDPESAFTHPSHLENLQDLHFVQNRLAPMDAALDSLDATLRELLGLNAAADPAAPAFQAFRSHRSEIAAYRRALRVVMRRGRAVAELFDRALTLRMSLTAQGQSEHVLELTRSTVDDSVTVRAITVVSLIYLSFSVVGTVMDMPFFSIDPDTKALQLSPQIWIFFLISVPLTLISIGYWQWKLELKKRAQRRRILEAKQAGV